MPPLLPPSTLFPYTTLFRSHIGYPVTYGGDLALLKVCPAALPLSSDGKPMRRGRAYLEECRSEEHTSELQSRGHLVCRLLLEKKKKKKECESTCARHRAALT